MQLLKSNLLNAASLVLLLCGTSGTVLAQDAAREFQQLSREIARLQAEVSSYEAENEIENLQRIFGFYIDKQLWTQAADLFADDATVEIGGEGVYRGKARILQYLASKGPEGPQPGILNDQMQLQPVVHVYGNGTAKARWHLFSQEAEFGVDHYWGTGIYENDYILEDGVWKIKALHLYSSMRTPYDDGWGVTGLPRSTPDTTLPPDASPSIDYENYPAVFVPPFHYENPVTGKPAELNLATEQAISSPQAMSQTLTELERRIGLLTDADAVERLHTIYGYYLARNQWDHLTGIFTEDGIIEIALRGQYIGRPSVRRNLDLYGVQDQLPGSLHNHMQYQPVIHIDPDGQTAYMRSRAFSMMGDYGGVGRWMGGTYENIFQKRDGVWQLFKDQQMNTYFAVYDDGWKDLQFRPAPGITDTNPPDAPPSTYFEMYPRAFLPPFHYVNPVSGRP